MVKTQYHLTTALCLCSRHLSYHTTLPQVTSFQLQWPAPVSGPLNLLWPKIVQPLKLSRMQACSFSYFKSSFKCHLNEVFPSILFKIANFSHPLTLLMHQLCFICFIILYAIIALSSIKHTAYFTYLPYVQSVSSNQKINSRHFCLFHLLPHTHLVPRAELGWFNTETKPLQKC